MFPEALTLGRLTLRPLDRALLVISLVAGFAFLFTRHLEPYAGSVVLKALGCSPLALLALRVLPDRDGLILGTSLIFSVGGDVFLGLDREDYFVFGLASFLIAHVFYIVLFIRSIPGGRAFSPLQKGASAVLAVYSLTMVAWMWTSLGDLLIPVIVYIAVITAMGVTSILAGFRAPWVVAGSILFILSDSVIAITKFKFAMAAGPWLIWSMYYIGQYLIVVGFVREKLGQEDIAGPAY